MRGLRTNEGANFEKYFAIIEEEAKKLGGVFFSETGQGRDLDLEDIEVCDLVGWLVPFDQTYESEKEACTLFTRPIEELWKELKINDSD